MYVRCLCGNPAGCDRVRGGLPASGGGFPFESTDFFWGEKIVSESGYVGWEEITRRMKEEGKIATSSYLLEQKLNAALALLSEQVPLLQQAVDDVWRGRATEG